MVSMDDASRPRGWLSEHVTQRLRRAIMDGELALGTALSEAKLATVLGISRSPVRDAMAALARQGLIVIEPQRASFVFMPSNEDILKLCEFRCMLEMQALRLAIQHQPDATLAQLHAAEQDMAHALREGDTLRSARADSRFHATAIKHSANPYLRSAWQLVSGKVGALRANISRPAMREQSNVEHQRIIAHLQAHNLDAALEALQTHILKMSERYRIESSLIHKRQHCTLEHLGALAED